jgi:hypothetical protein
MAGVDASRRIMCSEPGAGVPVAVTDAVATAVAVAVQVEHGVAELRTAAVGVAVAVTTAVGLTDVAGVEVGEAAPGQVTGTEMASRTVAEPASTSVKLFGWPHKTVASVTPIQLGPPMVVLLPPWSSWIKPFCAELAVPHAIVVVP